MQSYRSNPLNQSICQLLETHIQKKNYNDEWLGKMIQANQATNQKLLGGVKEFPYYLSSKSKTTTIVKENLQPFEVGNLNRVPSQPIPDNIYLITMPCIPDKDMQPDDKSLKQVIKAIEVEAFDTTVDQSQLKVANQTALVIGLNTFYSIDSERNYQFKHYVSQLPSYLKEGFLTIRVIPFFWSPWKSLSERDKKFLLPVDKCYMLVKSYFNSQIMKALDRHLNLFQYFGVDRAHPIKSLIPYQEIRNQILHSPQLKSLAKLFLQRFPKAAQYVLSLDSDFISLKTDECGLLSYYDEIVNAYNLEQKSLPSAMSTGYIAPEDEDKMLIKMGIELDRKIRAAVAPVLPLAVYMPEPNFAFLVKHPNDLILHSWKGGVDMTTESRRLISNAIKKKLIDPNSIVFVNQGAIQTKIDSDWHTAIIEKYRNVDRNIIAKKNVLKALRGLHQSYFNSQIWANNLYIALNRKVTNHMVNVITPLKEVRHAFDPYNLMEDIGNYYGKYSKSVFEKSLKIAYSYILFLFESYEASSHQHKTYAEHFASFCSPKDTQLKGFLSNLLKVKLGILNEAAEKLKKAGYTKKEIKNIVLIAKETGLAINEFFDSI